MTVLVTYAPGAEGQAALRTALSSLEEDEKVVVVLAGLSGADFGEVQRVSDEVRDVLDAAAVRYEVSPTPEGADVGDHTIALAETGDARLVVFGLRRRTREARLELGSQARRVILEAVCPVLVVKSVGDGADGGIGPDSLS